MTYSPVAILDQLRGRGCRFTIIPPAGYKYTRKDGSVKTYTGKDPQGKGWADEGGSNYAEDDKKLLEAISKGWNHGLVCGTGGVVPFDADETERLMELGVIQKLPPTIQVESRPGHRHHHLLIPGLKKKFVFYDPVKTRWKLVNKPKDGADPRRYTFRRQRLHLGEVLGPGGHTVLPGSTHPSGTTYHLVEGGPQEMAMISLDQLKEILRGLEFSPDSDKHVTFEEAVGIKTPRDRLEEVEADSRKAKAKKTDLSPLSDQLDVQRVIAAYGWIPKRVEGDEAKGPAPGHRSESGDCFQINLRTGQWHCKQCEAGGDLASLVGVMAGIIPCTGHKDLRKSEIFARVLEECEERGFVEGKETPSPEARDLVEALEEKLRDDPQKIEDPDAKRALLYLREHDRIRYGLLVKDLPIGRRDLDKGLDQLAAKLEAEKAEEEEPPDEPDEEIKAEAARIIAKGRSFEYIHKVWQKRHLGDARAGKVLIISTGAQSCSNTSGIHVILNGPRGCGKSDILQTMAYLLPQKHLLFGDMSPQAIYYFAQKMPDGAVVAFDDVTFNDTYAAVQKRCTTRFQEGAEHRVVLERGPWTFKTKPRISFWCTSVDRQFDEQLQDRYFAVNVEDSPEHKAAVIEFMKARDAGIDREEEERETRICRAIIRDLKDHLFEVVIPFADRITLLPGVGERGYKIISDMVKAFCAFRYAVRETDDRGRLVATEKDFEDAKALFDDAEGHGEEKYTEAEKRVLRAIIQCAYVATLESLADVTGLSSGRLKDIINGRGRDEQQRHGLLAKCHSLAVERVSETVYYEPEADKPKSKTTTHNEYRLDRNFALSEVYNSLVYLEPAARDDDVPRRTDDVVGDVKQNDVRREGDVDDVVEEREIENTSDTSRGGTTLTGGVVTSGEKISPSPKKPITTSTTPKRALDNDLGGVNPYVGVASGYVDDVLDTSTSERDLPKNADSPEEGRLPTAEESEVLEDLAGRLLQNWPGLPEMVLWEKARGKQGSRLPLGVVRSWLKVQGYVETGQRLNGASLWNPPTSSGEVAA